MEPMLLVGDTCTLSQYTSVWSVDVCHRLTCASAAGSAALSDMFALTISDSQLIEAGYAMVRLAAGYAYKTSSRKKMDNDTDRALDQYLWVVAHVKALHRRFIAGSQERLRMQRESCAA